jgi:hypothetical protein
LEDSAQTRRQNGQRGRVFRFSQLRMLPMHALGQDSGGPSKGGNRCRSVEYVQRFGTTLQNLGYVIADFFHSGVNDSAVTKNDL